MARKILALVVGLITAFGVVFIVEMIATLFAPQPPKNIAYENRAEMLAYLNSLPMSVLLTVLLAYILGAFAGGFVVTKMARRESPGAILSLIVAGFLLVAGILNFFVILPGQPVWFVASSLISYFPFALLGHRFARGQWA